MDVYFGRNFWYRGQERHESQPGLCLKSGAKFCYGGFLWCVPAVYVCREGIVADICRRVPGERLQEFWDVWGRWQGREEEMSPHDQMRAQRENPFFFEADFRLEIDGREWIRAGSSGMCIEPYRIKAVSSREEKAGGDGAIGESQGRPAQDKEREISSRAPVCPEEEIAAEYGLDRQDGWQVFRCNFRDEEDGAAGRKAVDKTGFLHFRLTVAARQVRLPCGCSFVTEIGCGKRIERFFHPVTGQIMELAVLGCREYNMETEEPFFRKHKKGYRLPGHGCVVEYILKPELPPGEYLTVRDCCQGDGPVLVDGDDGHGRAAAVALIGGCDGPVSVFAAGKAARERQDAGSSYGYSSLYFEPVREVRWEAELCTVPFDREIFELRAEGEDYGQKG